ncbi:hypothetical protein [Halalkalibacter akibai]|uniref:hypothetical protein n=1 Tax=Halalkalibacter akibai TaxID=1411 RepID=UPI00054E1FEB|nr:hypothetical protein [Halalkalibacter akibai]
MNKILISILGVIVVSICMYYITTDRSKGETVVDAEVLQTEIKEETEQLEENEEAVITKVDASEQLAEPVAYQPGQETAVKNIIAKQHDFLNELAGWGNAESVNSTELQHDRNWMKLEEDVKWLMEEGFAESLILEDMLHATEFLSISSQTGDEMAIRYLHRIFHDLDAHINEEKVDRIWNVTIAFGSEGQQNQLYAYLSGSNNE